MRIFFKLTPYLIITWLILCLIFPAGAATFKDEYPKLSKDYMKIKLVSDTLLKHRVKELKKFIDNNFEGEVTLTKKWLKENIEVTKVPGQKYEMSSKYKTFSIQKEENGLWYFKISN